MEETKILIIEDQKEHLDDVMNMLNQRQRLGVPIVPKYATTLDEAFEQVEAIQGIISDVFFPRNKVKGEPLCQADQIISLARESKIPIILCTDGYHHDPNLQRTVTDRYDIWEYKYPPLMCSVKDPELVGIYLGLVEMKLDSSSTYPITKAPIKNWPCAYFKLMAKICPEEAESFKRMISAAVESTENLENILSKYRHNDSEINDLKRICGR